MIQLEQVQQEIKIIVDEAPPGFVYKKQPGSLNCQNVRKDNGVWVADCLVGQWIVRFLGQGDPAGMAIELSHPECRSSGAPGTLSFLLRHRILEFDISELALAFLMSLQGAQDAGTTWVEALARATSYVEGVVFAYSDHRSAILSLSY